MNIIARRGATKKDLLRRGQYESIPSVILADTGLTATAKLVYIALVSHLFHGKRAVWPSVERLAAMVGQSPSAVKGAIRLLSKKNLIHVQRRRRDTNVYRFTIPSGLKSAPQDASDGPRRLKYGCQDALRKTDSDRRSRESVPTRGTLSDPQPLQPLKNTDPQRAQPLTQTELTYLEFFRGRPEEEQRQWQKNTETDHREMTHDEIELEAARKCWLKAEGERVKALHQRRDAG